MLTSVHMLEQIAGIVSALLFILIEWPRIAPRLRSLLGNVFSWLLVWMGVVGAGAVVHGVLTLDLSVVRFGLIFAAFAVARAWKHLAMSLALLGASYWVLGLIAE